MVRAIGVLLLGLISVGASAQRILGYFPDYRATNTIQYDKVTDIAFSFMNPETNGQLHDYVTAGDNLYSFDMNKFLTVKAGASGNTNLWLAVGGADDAQSRSARLNSVTGNASTRATFVAELVAFAETHSLYGIAIDWEFPDGTTQKNNHETFLRALRVAIDASSRPQTKISVAVGGETVGTVNHVQDINAAVLTDADLVDEFHLMCYDFPSNNYDNNNHSHYDDAITCIAGWSSAGIPKGKMLLAVPFYGRSSNRITELGYNEMWGNEATNFAGDYAAGVYYNGKGTLEDKSQLIMDQGGLGVAIWDLGQDKTGTYSLLSVIFDKMEDICGAPQPSLGADQGVCGDVSILLDGGVSTFTGRTFQWSDESGDLSGETNPTYTATTNGIYTLTISQDGCSRSDVVEIAAGSPLAATGSEGCEGDD